MTPAVKRLAAVHIFCTVVKGGAAAWSASRSQSRMEAPERARSMVAQAAGQPHFCLATERLCGPPVGGTFWFQILIQASSPEIWRKTISGVRGVAGAVSGVACFWVTSFRKKFIGGELTFLPMAQRRAQRRRFLLRCAPLAHSNTCYTSSVIL